MDPDWTSQEQSDGSLMDSWSGIIVFAGGIHGSYIDIGSVGHLNILVYRRPKFQDGKYWQDIGYLD